MDSTTSTTMDLDYRHHMHFLLLLALLLPDIREVTPVRPVLSHDSNSGNANRAGTLEGQVDLQAIKAEARTAKESWYELYQYECE